MQQREPMQVTKLFLASSNPGKLREYLELARGSGVAIELLPRFGEFPSFEESAPTFAENSAGKALHYSRFTDEAVLADDSGLVVPALGGAPGVHSARYAGAGATDGDRGRKLVREMHGKAVAVCLRNGCSPGGTRHCGGFGPGERRDHGRAARGWRIWLRSRVYVWRAGADLRGIDF